MKQLIIALISAASLNAFSCPTITGHFECKDFDSGAVQDIVLTQSTANGVVTYKMQLTQDGKTNIVDYVADGIAKSIKRDGFKVRTNKTYCTTEKVLTEIYGERDNGDVLQAVETVKINAAGDFYNSYVGKDGNKDLAFEEICKRK